VGGLKHQKEKRSMDHFAGLDVSVKETSVCIVDGSGKIVREVKVASEPDALLAVLRNPAYHFKRIGLEAGPPGERTPTTGIVRCCARAASGQTAADQAITLMKSRRRIAFTKAGTTPSGMRLQQGFPTGGMGSDRHFAWQQPSGSNVRFGSKADMTGRICDVCLPPKADIS
jgi:hypothetical protein